MAIANLSAFSLLTGVDENMAIAGGEKTTGIFLTERGVFQAKCSTLSSLDTMKKPRIPYTA
jgi:hypothetical protein